MVAYGNIIEIGTNQGTFVPGEKRNDSNGFSEWSYV
jgi:hypothetical protein